MIPDRRALYVDCDVMAVADVRPIFATDLGDDVIGCVADPVGGSVSKLPRIEGDPYVNTGVMLMNLEALREDDFLSRGVAIYERHQAEIIWVEQCIINKYAEGRKHLLDPRYNALVRANRVSEEEFRRYADPDNTTLLHFFGRIKPWDRKCPAFVSSFWQHSIREPVLQEALREWFGIEYQLRRMQRSIMRRLKKRVKRAP